MSETETKTGWMPIETIPKDVKKALLWGKVDNSVGGTDYSLTQNWDHERERACAGGVEMTWQPIETAPKDGTHFLAVDGTAQVVVFWHSYTTKTGRTSVLASVTGLRRRPRRSFTYSSLRDFDPTHWMPLPEPPK